MEDTELIYDVFLNAMKGCKDIFWKGVPSENTAL